MLSEKRKKRERILIKYYNTELSKIKTQGIKLFYTLVRFDQYNELDLQKKHYC